MLFLIQSARQQQTQQQPNTRTLVRFLNRVFRQYRLTLEETSYNQQTGQWLPAPTQPTVPRSPPGSSAARTQG